MAQGKKEAGEGLGQMNNKLGEKRSKGSLKLSLAKCGDYSLSIKYLSMCLNLSTHGGPTNFSSTGHMFNSLLDGGQRVPHLAG